MGRLDAHRLDAHITGLYDPCAPFNQPDFPHPQCESCLNEECNPWEGLCPELERQIYEDYMAERRGDLAMYLGWLLEVEWREAMDLDLSLKRDWLIVNLLNIVGVHPQKYIKYIPFK